MWCDVLYSRIFREVVAIILAIGMAYVVAQGVGVEVLMESYGYWGLIILVALFWGLFYILRGWLSCFENTVLSRLLIGIVLFVCASIALGIYDAANSQLFVKAEKITLIHLFSFFGAIATFVLVALRTSAANDQIQLLTQQIENQSEQVQHQSKQIELQAGQLRLQASKEIDDRFHSAVELLGNSETSARTGAIYSLYHLAVDEEKYRKEVVQILCSHIRSKTEEKKYREDYEMRPSNEIQTAIDLLFRGDATDIHGLCKKFPSDFFPIILSSSYFAGANFSNAACQGVFFTGSECQGAHFSYAQCQGAKFDHVNLEKTDFEKAELEGACFSINNGNFPNHLDVVILTREQQCVVKVLERHPRKVVVLEGKDCVWASTKMK